MAHSQVLGIIESETTTMTENPVLDAMESGNFSRENWTVWACQRYHAAHRFIPLLKAGIRGIESQGYTQLNKALQDNLDDENGDNNPQLGSHEKWRQNFYHALNITQTQLNRTILLPGTLEYRDTLSALEHGDFHQLIGALLYLEFSIPHEFRRIKTGRDTTFPEKFVITAEDSREIKRKKGQARMYIDHHIIHDADNHFPDLMNAVEPLLKSDGEGKIIEGARIIARAKTQFYDCLGYELGIAPNVRKSICSNPDFMPNSLRKLTPEMVKLWYQKALKIHTEYQNKEITNGVKIDGVMIERFDGYTFYSDIDGGDYGRYLRTRGILHPYYGIAFVTDNGAPHYHKQSDAFNLILSGTGIFIGTTPNRSNGEALSIGTEIHIPKNSVHGHSVASGNELVFFALQECGFDSESPCKGDFRKT